jgi:hypothetical protein
MPVIGADHPQIPYALLDFTDDGNLTRKPDEESVKIFGLRMWIIAT